jgi:hypothetical protein
LSADLNQPRFLGRDLTQRGQATWALVYQLLSLFKVLLSDPEFDATKQARPKPVHPNQVLVSQETFNAIGIQNAFDNDGFGQVPISTQDDELPLFLF